MAGLLSLNDCARTLVFRKVVDLVRNDATIKRVLGQTSTRVRAWDGTPTDSQPFTVDVAPSIRLTPQNGAEAFWSPGATRGPLFINVEMILKGSNVDDVQNLWWAVVRAIYPAAQSQTNAIVQALQQAGAYDGLATFTQPAFDSEPNGVFMAPVGQIRIEVNNVLLAG